MVHGLIEGPFAASGSVTGALGLGTLQGTSKYLFVDTFMYTDIKIYIFIYACLFYIYICYAAGCEAHLLSGPVGHIGPGGALAHYIRSGSEGARGVITYVSLPPTRNLSV